MESLNLKRFHGIAKVSGVVFCIAGVIVLAFYQGPELKSFNHHHFFPHISTSPAGVTGHPTRTWILGIFLTTLSTTSWALWTVLQGILVSGVAYYMQVWVIDKSGPVFLAMTMPITLLVTIMLSSFLLGEVTLGSIIGGVVMIGGLYCVLWAKRTEQIAVSKQRMAVPVQATQV